MREILFRGKGKETGVWFYGGLFKGVNFKLKIYTSIIPFVNHGEDFFYSLNDREIVIPETVGQFVGMDKNGKRIFEGDIVKDDNRTFVVQVMDYGTIHPFAYDWACGDFEVIGNIHDNPELLEE